MTTHINLRQLQVSDLPSAHALSQAVKWPHRLEDWQTLFSIGQGVAAVDAGNALQGVALWWLFGDDLATLGLVIVSPASQKSGIGRRLLETIMGAVDRRRVLLNATHGGLRLYEHFGFVAAGDICIHQGIIAPTAVPFKADALIRPMTVVDRAAVRALDRGATGGDRDALVTALEGVSQGFVAVSDSVISGYALCREFGRGRLIGPIVAESELTATALASTAALAAGGFLRIDIPEAASVMTDWLNGAGLPHVGRVKTMWRGSPLGDSRIKIFALASQAVG
jgi:GNAT superfamily N-acetyltransferase